MNRTSKRNSERIIQIIKIVLNTLQLKPYLSLISFFMINQAENLAHPQPLVKQPQYNRNKITLIRHAQSFANKAVKDFQAEKNLPYCWKTFHSFDDFKHRTIYNPEYCDCGISPKGQQECEIAKQKFKYLKIDLILVSPLERALQTCEKLFSDKFDQADIIVQPLLSESIKYSSDVSKRVSHKQKKFPKYNFDRLIEEGDFWFIKNDNQENQKLYFQHLDNFVHLSYEEKQKQIVKFMELKNLRQSNLNVRKRVKKIKQILKKYNQKYNNIVVVSHYYTIKHIMAQKVLPNGQTLDDFNGQNCSIHQEYLQNLLLHNEN